MFSTWFLHTLAFTLLVRGDVRGNQCSFYEVKPDKDSPLMNSLQCNNDYTSHVQCTWEVDSRVHSQANLSMNKLYFRDRTKETLCDSNKPSVLLSNGKILHTCRYNTTRFSTAAKHVLYFKSPCEPTATTLHVAKHGKVKAPIDLAEMAADGGGHLLSWKSPYPASSKITRTLVYQLQYRRYMNDWTTVDNIIVSEHLIDKESLLLGYQYEARVRVKGPVGLWSDWSPLLSWKTHRDVGPFNLQCVIEGETSVTCSWQMKTDNFQFISYNILCRDSNNTAHYPCCETPQLQSMDVELSEFACSVNTTDPYHLTVEFKPMQNSRTFIPSHNIKFPQPDQIRLTEHDGMLDLRWSKPNVKKLSFSTEIKISTSESSEDIIKNLDSLDYQIPLEKLRPLTDYQAQIRFLPTFIHISNRSHKIQPSEWSEPAAFTTKPVLSSTSPVFYILAVVFMSLFIIVLYNAFPVCRRRIMFWKGSVPSPIKSHVLEGMIKKYPTGWPYLQSEIEATSICVMLATDNISIKNSISREPSLLHKEDAVKTGLSKESNQVCTSVEESTSENKSGIVFNFSGPYILCLEDSSIQDKIFEGPSDKNDTSVAEEPESFTPVNGGYVVTPPIAMPETPNPAPVDSPTNDPSDEPPAYTPSTDQTCTVVPHPSGYFTMPCVATAQPQPRNIASEATDECFPCP